MGCNLKCDGMEWLKKSRTGDGTSAYDCGMKRCMECRGFVRHEGRYCPCCGRQLRHRPKGSGAKRERYFARAGYGKRI